MAVDPSPIAVSPTPVQRVRGTLDVLPPQEARLRGLERTLRESFEPFGYEGIQTPVLEPLELFRRKSGDEIMARMYSFVHWNRSLCLRPELTASAMRLFVDELQGATLPVRLHYGGPTFRYEKPQRGRYRQFTQVGLELIGAEGPAADAEVLHLACRGLEEVGVRRYRLVVGHLGIVLQLLAQFGMSEYAQGLVLDLMEPLARGRLTVEAAVRRVVSLLGTPEDGAEQTAGILASLPADQATEVAAEVLRHVSLPVEGGVRSRQAILQRLLDRAQRADPTARVRATLELVEQLHALAGPAANLERVSDVLRERGLSTQPLDEVGQALEALSQYGPPSEGARWEVDLSLARGLRYYTGLVFEIYADTAEGPIQVGGGGRYDDLIRALGGRRSLPACGFSYGLERLDLVRQETTPPAPTRPRVLVVPVSAADHAASLELAAELRAALPEWVVEQDVRLRGPREALRHADRSAARAVVLIGEQERAGGEVVLRDLRGPDQQRVPRARAAEALRALETAP